MILAMFRVVLIYCIHDMGYVYINIGLNLVSFVKTDQITTMSIGGGEGGWEALPPPPSEKNHHLI